MPTSRDQAATLQLPLDPVSFSSHLAGLADMNHCRSGQDGFDDLAVNVSETKIPTLKPIGQSRVINA